jgi:hypothetical protein
VNFAQAKYVEFFGLKIFYIVPDRNFAKEHFSVFLAGKDEATAYVRVDNLHEFIIAKKSAARAWAYNYVMKSFWRNNSLSIVVFGLFGLFLTGQIFTGFAVDNQDLQEHGATAISFGAYLLSGHFMEAVFENWESEFLQMSAYVVLTVFLVQKGSAESKAPGKFEQVDAAPKAKRGAPWPVRRGGWTLMLYQNSLALALFGLFLMSFALHGIGGARAACDEAKLHGQQCESVVGYMTGTQFWFESFQNWQSEFLAVGSLVLLSIWLRQQGSPESKPVSGPDEKTGE